MIKIVDKLLHAGEGRRLKTLEDQVQADHRAGAGDGRALGRAAARQDRRVPAAPRQRRAAGRPALRGVRGRTRRRQAGAWHAAVRRAGHGRHRAPRRRHRRDEDRRGQDARRHHAHVPQRSRRQGRAPGHGQRLPGQARRRVDGSGLSLHGPHRRRHPGQHGPGRAPRDVRRRHHVRHQQRVRLRLPARQHDNAPRAHGAARSLLLHRGRGRLDPHRRGAHAAHHQRRARDGRRHVPPVRARRAPPAPRR